MDIDLTIKNYRCFPDTEPARITIRDGFTAFVGINNAGKSSLLKFFYEFRGLFQHLRDQQFLLALLGVPQTIPPARFINFPAPVSDPAEAFYRANNRDIEVELLVHTPANTAQRVLLTVARSNREIAGRLEIANRHLLGAPTGLSMTGHSLNNGGQPVEDLDSFFEASQALSDTFYVGPFRNAINIGTKTNYYDIQVGQALITQWRAWKTGPNNEQNEAAYRLTEALRRIFGYQALEINAAQNEESLQLFVNGRSYRLSELGSGLTQFFLVLANAATRSPTPSFILIDEPELNLHPALQLDFLTTLGTYASNGVLFSTHGIGLARASAERIYSVRQIAAEGPETVSEVLPYEATPRLSEFLGALSLAGYKELGFDTVVLVEGPTEVKTIQQFLRLYHKDHQVVLLPMGGFQGITQDVQTQLEEVKRLSEHVYALIDSERSKANELLEPKRAAFVQECEAAQVPCYVLERRAVENYFTDDAVQRRFGSNKYRALGPYERLKDVPNGWPKTENWRIAREMSREEIEATDLGQFLGSL